ncbi:MgtC/SapB family protein [Paenibacillus sp. P36]
MLSHDSIWHISDMSLTFRMILSVVLGGLIGLEREWSNHAAGLRTHILVCVGSTTIMLLSIYGFNDFIIEPNVRVDPARLAAQVISGIGFLGAGAIMRTGATVYGLTTAASIWVVAAIGLSVGAGFYYVSILAAILVLFCLFVLNHWEKYLLRKRRHKEFILCVSSNPESLNLVFNKLTELKIHIRTMQMIPRMERAEVSGYNGEVSLGISIKVQNDKSLTDILKTLISLPDVLGVEPSAQHEHSGGSSSEHIVKSLHS